MVGVTQPGQDFSLQHKNDCTVRLCIRFPPSCRQSCCAHGRRSRRRPQSCDAPRPADHLQFSQMLPFKVPDKSQKLRLTQPMKNILRHCNLPVGEGCGLRTLSSGSPITVGSRLSMSKLVHCKMIKWIDQTFEGPAHLIACFLDLFSKPFLEKETLCRPFYHFPLSPSLPDSTA